jgi:hypothetical protein
MNSVLLYVPVQWQQPPAAAVLMLLHHATWSFHAQPIVRDGDLPVLLCLTW